jgi:DNA (cytosine-5)-methyltransferase 1
MVGEITAVSLFAGVGGFDLALERSGVKVVASVEWDKKAQEVLRRHFPSSTIFGDISGVTGEQLISAGFNPKRGIITGGFPCQDLSVAGKRAGLQGSRSGLFWEIVRLLTETKAENFILENVPGLLSSNDGRDMATVITALDDIGFDVAWRVLDAQHFGVPQRRRRVFIVGCLRGSGGTPEEILAISEGRARYLEKGNQTRKGSTTSASDSVGRSSENTISAFSPSSFAQYTENQKVSATLRAGGGDLGGGSETLFVPNTIGTLTVSDLQKGQTNHQAINSGLLQVVDVVD